MPKETIASLKQQNQSLKQQVDALCKAVKSLKESFAATRSLLVKIESSLLSLMPRTWKLLGACNIPER